LADKNLLVEIENRLSRIDIDGVLESGYIEQFIEESTYSPFPPSIVYVTAKCRLR